jgi:hypothetical protein
MPESDVGMTEAAAGTRAADDAGPAAETAAEAPVRTSWFFYGLGLSVQTLLWFLLFLALVVAVAVGSELTEFRYVGF